MMAATLGLNKVFILDKYFTELNKYWQNECLHQEKSQNNLNNYNYGYRLNKGNNKKIDSSQPITITSDNINDLIHLEAPITEDSLIRALHSRFLSNEFFTNIGPVLVSLNPYDELHNPLTLDSAHRNDDCYPLYRIVNEAVRQQTETGYPQAIILSGVSGSGKTYSSMIILRQLFNLVGGGPETDAFKHLAATFTVLRSLGSAKTNENSESSRIGNFIEVQITDGAIYRTKIHCYFLDQSRVVKRHWNERNYHIFYQMFYGLNFNEKTKLYLDGYNINDFEYLNHDSFMNYDDLSQQQQHVNRFEAWKSCLSVLGISFMDVARVLAAILLLGNIKFEDDNNDNQQSYQAEFLDGGDIKTFQKEMHAVASLLGVSGAILFKGLTIRTHCTSKGQIVKSNRSAQSSKLLRDSLAKALYIRTVATIIRRANSSKRLGSTCGTTSSESNESFGQNHLETSSNHHAPSSIGSACGKSYKTMAVLNNAVRYSTMDGFIGILDMFGFEDSKPSRLEQLCINLCAETMQHFYNTHIFKSSIESCRDEGIKPDLEIDYVDNVPCIDLISSLRTGLFSLIDYESFDYGDSESLVRKQNSIHGSNNRYLEVNNNQNNFIFQNINIDTEQFNINKCFGIKHFCGNVLYDTSDFILSNSDRLSDNIVSVFHKSQCSFGFVTHLFGAELRMLKNKGSIPLGIKFRIAPTSHQSDFNNNSTKCEPNSTFTQDFHSRLDNLLRTLVHARPHFIRCIKINDREQFNCFDKFSLMRQIRALQMLETVNLMAEGLPHRMRFKAFISRYRSLVHSNAFKQCKNEDSLIEDCKIILRNFDKIRANTNHSTAALTSWTLGRKHVFLSESARQQLEIARNGRRNAAATLIQSTWRGYHLRCRWPQIKQAELCAKSITNHISNNHNHGQFDLEQDLKNKLRPRPQPILSTPPPFGNYTVANKFADVHDFDLIKETFTLLGIDSNIAPPLPSSRSYTISGNTKYFFPQVRTLKMDFIDPLNNLKINKNQKIIIHGFSNFQRGCFTAEYKELNFEIPQQYLEQIVSLNQMINS